jgi:uncharacterized protein (TIGR03437 family)
MFLLRLTAFIYYLSLSAAAQVHVLTSNYDNGRTGANLAEAQLNVANVTPGSFGLLGSFPVDGQMFAQPLYVSGINIPGLGVRDVLFVTTEHNTVYAYDARSAAVPKLLWRRNLGPPLPTAMVPTDAASGAFIDVNPEVGILSTGTIDPQANVLYVVASTVAGGIPGFELHALDLATGQERMNGPVEITAAVTGQGAGSQDDVIAFDPGQHIQRPGLVLANGAVYVAFGSHADFRPWHGWLIAYDASNLPNRLGVFQTTPGGLGGAIWQSGRGLAADDDGSIYFVTGNGDYDGVRNFSQSIVKVSGSEASLADWYTPANWKLLSDSDYDLSAGPAILPGTHQVIGGDKKGNLYLLDGENMGHLDTAKSARVVPAVSGFIFSLALWTRPDATYVYVREADSSLKALRITGKTIDSRPVSVSSPAGGTSRVGMALSANGSQEGTGILWVTTGDYLDPSTRAILHAYDASNLSKEVWNSDMSPADSLGGFAKFVTPTVVNGRVYAAAAAEVMVYGLLPQEGEAFTPPVIAAVENSASFGPAAISPGEMISIFGANLGPPDAAGLQLDDAGKVATTVSGTVVLVDGVPAPLVFASANQVNAVVPFGVSSTMAEVQVLYQGSVSALYSVPVKAANPGLFSAGSSGSGQVLAVNQNGTMNGIDNPAAPNSVIVLYATGAGRTTPSAQDGTVADADHPLLPVQPVTVEIAGHAAQVLYAGSAPGNVAGFVQLNVVVPPGANPGAAVPVVFKVGDRSSQDGLTLAIR